MTEEERNEIFLGFKNALREAYPDKFILFGTHEDLVAQLMALKCTREEAEEIIRRSEVKNE